MEYKLEYCKNKKCNFNELLVKNLNARIEFLEYQIEEINLNQFPAFAIALTVTEMEDQSRMIAYNAANEFAVEAFLQDRIKFTDISKIILEQMSNFVEQDITTTHDVIAVDKEVKLKCNEFIGGISA